jgi:hypothetical protein
MSPARGRIAKATPRHPVRSALAVVLAAAALSAGCAVGADHDDDGGGHTGGPLRLPPVANIDEGAPTPVADIGPGSCLNTTDPLDDQHRRRILGCASPHRYQVYAARIAPHPAESEKDRVRESVGWCEAELAKALPRAGIDRKTLMIDTFDDYRPGVAQRAVACAVGYNDLRQTQTAIVP